jgi:DtxR family Mn-dependent transcriptional regulator
MENNQKWDECIEKLWYMKEKNQTSLEDLKDSLGSEFNDILIEELLTEGIVQLSENYSQINLTEIGDTKAQQLIRSHRLAERLVYDVLGGEFEAGACEFEHIANPTLVNSICTLLGHPKECPHGMPIPPGLCCENSLETTDSSVFTLSNMEVGQSARIAYINCRDDRRMHKLEGLQIRPGMTIKLHQRSPTMVIECEGASIALDESICDDIRLWKSTSNVMNNSMEHTTIVKPKKKKRIFHLNMFKK